MVLFYVKGLELTVWAIVKSMTVWFQVRWTDLSGQKIWRLELADKIGGYSFHPFEAGTHG